jgi:hypothetical protein
MSVPEPDRILETSETPAEEQAAKLPAKPDRSALFWDVRETATYLELAESSVRLLIWQRKISHYHIGPNGGRIRVKPQAADEYLESCVQKPRRAKAQPAIPTPEAPAALQTPRRKPTAVADWEFGYEDLYRADPRCHERPEDEGKPMRTRIDEALARRGVSARDRARPGFIARWLTEKKADEAAKARARADARAARKAAKLLLPPDPAQDAKPKKPRSK